MKKIQFIIASSLFLLFSTHSYASIVHIDFTGKISSAGSFIDPTGLFSQGDVLSGYWEFDSTVSDSDSDITRGIYSQLQAFEINIGLNSFETNDYTLQILNNFSAGIGVIDAYDVLGGASTSNIAGLTVNQMQWTIRDTQLPLDALDSDSLFVSAPDLSAFDQIGQAQGQITGSYNGNQFFMNLELDSVSSSVPEPSILAMMGVGLAGLGFVRRRKQKI